MVDNPDVRTAYEALVEKNAPYSLLWKYYEGDQPLKYTAQKLREVFRQMDVTFNENWCAVVVDATLERLQLADLTVLNNEDLTARLKGLMTTTELDLEDDPIHLATLVCGEAFLVAWRSKDGKPEAYYNDPRLCHVEYDGDNPNKKLWAAKRWREGRVQYLTLYYPERLEYYHTKAGEVSSHKAFRPRTGDEEIVPEENPYGVIPVFHFRRLRRSISSELTNVLPIQDAVNKLVADMMVAAEFGAFPQRWIIANTDTKTLKASPFENWEIPAGDGQGQQSSVGQFQATQLKNFIDAIDSKVSAISAISRTPHHFFFRQGSVPSGEALIALEAPLNKKATRLSKILGRTWQRVAQFLLLLEDAEVNVEDIQPTFEPVQTVQPKTEAEIRQINVSAGLPLETVLREQGWSQERIDQMRKDRMQEQADQQNSYALALLAQERQFSRGEGEE